MALQLTEEQRITPIQYSAKDVKDPLWGKKALFHYTGDKALHWKAGGIDYDLTAGEAIILSWEEYFNIVGDSRLKRRYWHEEKLRVMDQGRGPMWLVLRPDPKFADVIPDPPDTEVPAIPASATVMNPMLELEVEADPVTQRDQLKVLANAQMAQIKERDAIIGEMRALVENQEKRLRALESGGGTEPDIDIPEVNIDEPPLRRGPGRPRRI